VAEAYGRPIVSHLCPEVLSHAVTAVPHGLIVEYLPWFAAALKEPLQPVNGKIVHRPDRPGLGVEIDDAAMQQYAYAA
ncbi:MAG: mandelate racemase, partial [Chloroflexi bacterium]|nr:mandelate racemase [Chloroflexota bacterium]